MYASICSVTLAFWASVQVCSLAPVPSSTTTSFCPSFSTSFTLPVSHITVKRCSWLM